MLKAVNKDVIFHVTLICRALPLLRWQRSDVPYPVAHVGQAPRGKLYLTRTLHMYCSQQIGLGVVVSKPTHGEYSM